MKLQPKGQDYSHAAGRANRITGILFAVYLVALCWILLFKLGVRFDYMDTRRVNLIPFESFVLYGRMDASESLSNVLIFIPLGIYTGVLFRNWGFSKKLLLCCAVSCLCEVLQFVFRIGAFDITDIITNTSGGLVGLLLFKALEKGFNNTARAQQFVNIVAALGTISMIVLLVLLKTNNLGIRYQ